MSPTGSRNLAKMLELSGALWQILGDDEDPFKFFFDLDGEEFRRVKSRRTFRFEADGKGYFVKVHRGIGYREIFKNLFQFKLPVIGAANEYRAIKLLNAANIPTMTVAAFGERGWNPAKKESFLVTDELVGMISLEDLTSAWSSEPPESRFKHLLIRRLAESSGAMHRLGVNHRDCYICHYLFDPKDESGKLFVIDLHRAQCRKKVPYRYLVKDVAGLFFSSMDIGLSRRDYLRFVKIYSRCASLKSELRRNAAFYRDVKRTAEKLYRKEFAKLAPEIF